MYFGGSADGCVRTYGSTSTNIGDSLENSFISSTGNSSDICTAVGSLLGNVYIGVRYAGSLTTYGIEMLSALHATSGSITSRLIR